MKTNDMIEMHLKKAGIFVLFFAMNIFVIEVASATLPVGKLIQDGPPTPEQISIYLPIANTIDKSASAQVNYRLASGSEWIAAHPLHVINRRTNKGQNGEKAFAGVINDLTPGTEYQIKVTVHIGNISEARTLTAATRLLPGNAGAAATVIETGTPSKQIQKVLDDAKPGDVIQFARGTHLIDNLLVKKSGSPLKPIYIRGESREGTILKDASEKILNLLAVDDVIIENLTLQGSNIDSGGRAVSRGINLWNGGKYQERITIRNVTIKGVDMGIVAWGNTQQILVYDNTLKGNNAWEKKFLEKSISWNDDGIRLPGMGNAIFNNTLTGFGDALAMNQGAKNIGIHFYRNEILMTCDDAFEADYGRRNITFYDNRVHNSMTLVSVDPIYKGPLFVFRNIGINVGRQPYKLNNRNTGFFLYNNTVVRTNGFSSGSRWGWPQPNNGPLTAWGYCNNILIFKGTGSLLAMESGKQNPIDFTNNAWFPDGKIWWTNSGGSFLNLSEARSQLPKTAPVFGNSTQRHENDVICEPNPFVVDVQLGDHYLKQIQTLYTPALADGTRPRGAGISIPGITDGYSGKTPDIGAIITGRKVPFWGDRKGLNH